MLNRVAILSGVLLLVIAAGFAVTDQLLVAPTGKNSVSTTPLSPVATAPVVANPPPPLPQTYAPVPPSTPPQASVEPTVAPAPVIKPPAGLPVSPSVSVPPQMTATPPAQNTAPAAEPSIPPKPAITVEEAARSMPTWLKAHVGEGDGQIAQVVLQRARALYLQKVSDGAVKNPCYFAMDATRPNDLGEGKSGRRFYIICESNRSFHAISAGHGSGRNLKGIADFRDERRCAKNFSNALDSKLMAGGAYVTSEIKTSFKGFYRVSPKKDAALIRSFIQFDGEGEVANARQREIGGHAAELLKNVCLRKDPKNPYADHDGYIPFGNLVDYANGRSDGCTSWTLPDAQKIITMVKDNPTTLYIYPEAADINAVAHEVEAGSSVSHAGLYWNASCLKEIHAPKFWPKQKLEPILAQYKKDHPVTPGPTPICKAQ